MCSGEKTCLCRRFGSQSTEEITRELRKHIAEPLAHNRHSIVSTCSFIQSVSPSVHPSDITDALSLSELFRKWNILLTSVHKIIFRSGVSWRAQNGKMPRASLGLSHSGIPELWATGRICISHPACGSEPVRGDPGTSWNWVFGRKSLELEVGKNLRLLLTWLLNDLVQPI